MLRVVLLQNINCHHCYTVYIINQRYYLPVSYILGSGQSIQSQISEKDIIDVLENTARQIAASTLSRSDSGQDIEKDARVINHVLRNHGY